MSKLVAFVALGLREIITGGAGSADSTFVLGGMDALHGVSQLLPVVVLLEYGAHVGVGGISITCLQRAQDDGEIAGDRCLQCGLHAAIGELNDTVTFAGWNDSPQ